MRPTLGGECLRAGHEFFHLAPPLVRLSGAMSSTWKGGASYGQSAWGNKSGGYAASSYGYGYGYGYASKRQLAQQSRQAQREAELDEIKKQLQVSDQEAAAQHPPLPPAPSTWSASAEQWQRTAQNRQNAMDIKTLRSLISTAIVPEERQSLQVMLDRRLASTRTSMAPAQRVQEAIENAAQAVLKFQKAEKHFADTQENLDNARQAHEAAQTELRQAKQAYRGANTQSTRANISTQPIQQHAFQQAAAWVAELQCVGSAQGADIVVPQEAFQQLLATLQQSGGMHTAPQVPQQCGTSMPNVHQEAMHSAVQHQVSDADDDFDIGGTDFEGFRAESDPGEQQLRRALRQKLHPTRGRRLPGKQTLLRPSSAAAASSTAPAAVKGSIQKRR